MDYHVDFVGFDFNRIKFSLFEKRLNLPDAPMMSYAAAPQAAAVKKVRTIFQLLNS